MADRREIMDMLDYNGLRSDLMDELYEEVRQHTDVDSTLTLYIARACRVLEKNGWRKVKEGDTIISDIIRKLFMEPIKEEEAWKEL